MHASFLTRPLATTTARLCRPAHAAFPTYLAPCRPLPCTVNCVSSSSATTSTSDTTTTTTTTTTNTNIRSSSSSSSGTGVPQQAINPSSPSTAPSPTPATAATAASSTTPACTLMDPEVETLIKSMHANPAKAVVYVTGGGVQALSWLLSVPGASNTIIEASVPYARESLISVLGHEPSQYCSEDTAVQIAIAAYRRAAALNPGYGTPLVGVGATCALASVPLKRGEHRAFVACHGQEGTRTLSLTFAKGERTRSGEDELASRSVVRLMAQAMGVEAATLSLPLITTPTVEGGRTDVVHEALRPAADPIDALLSGSVKSVEYGPNGQVVVDAPRRHRVILPGSFNPLHKGHRALLAAAVQQHKEDHGEEWAGCFELSVGNADKGWLPADEVRRRVAQFTSEGIPVVLTSAPLFTLKAELLRECKFVLGYDTAVRIVMQKYYGTQEGGSYTAMLMDFARLRAAGCSFLVAGRRDNATGEFKSLADIVDMPPELADLFEAVPESAFRVDLSSTELRRRAASQDTME